MEHHHNYQTGIVDTSELGGFAILRESWLLRGIEGHRKSITVIMSAKSTQGLGGKKPPASVATNLIGALDEAVWAEGILDQIC